MQSVGGCAASERGDSSFFLAAGEGLVVGAMTNGFFEAEAELQRIRAQRDSVRGKDTPYRVEFRYRGGIKHWQYFTGLEDASKASDSLIRCSISGREYLESPRRQQIQIRGPRGGWSPYRHD